MKSENLKKHKNGQQKLINPLDFHQRTSLSFQRTTSNLEWSIFQGGLISRFDL